VKGQQDLGQEENGDPDSVNSANNIVHFPPLDDSENRKPEISSVKG